jgi:hypothetical protein
MFHLCHDMNPDRKQALQLEAIYKKKVAQLRGLEAENARLKQKEWALQSCILAIEGSVAATKAVLEANESEADACDAANSESLLSACNPATPSFSSAESSGSMRSQAGPQGSDASSSMAAQVRGCKKYSSLDKSKVHKLYRVCC